MSEANAKKCFDSTTEGKKVNFHFYEFVEQIKEWRVIRRWVIDHMYKEDDSPKTVFPAPKIRHRNDVLFIISLTRVIFKRNELLIVFAEKVKIEYFFEKIFNCYVYVSVDNDTIKILKEI